MIELVEHSVHFDSVTALDSISLSIKEGEKVAIIGSSGAGKSTLLRELYRLGGVRSSFIHQQLALVPQLTVFHNVYMGQLDSFPVTTNIRNLIYPHPKQHVEILAILDSLGIADLISRRVSRLSGGEQQRVSIARALYRAAPCLLGDEPISAIDPSNSERVMRLLNTLQTTVVLSMHDVEMALKHCLRIIGLRQGKIAFDLPSSEVDNTNLYSLYALC